jgi:phospholipid/cholesterol/gamma-HCH transport system permease protein
LIRAITNLISASGAWGLSYLPRLGGSGIFVLQSLRPRVLNLACLQRFVAQVYYIGVLSFIIIFFSSMFIGMVVSLQGYNTLHKFAAEAQLGQLLALSIVRELGPVVTALLFAGRAGSALASEVGLMRATDQLSAMSMMAVDPIRFVISPRMWAGIVSMPILTAFFNMFAIFGGFLVGVKWLGVDAGSFWNNMSSSVSFYDDICTGLFKSLVFGFIVVWVALYQGYNCEPNAGGISRAATKTVVYSSVAILAMDFILTSILMGSH